VSATSASTPPGEACTPGSRSPAARR
jgi:hypothetical protein